jgi:hypothetical protein
MKYDQSKRSIVSTLCVTIFAGLLFGILYLFASFYVWVYAPTIQGFLACLAAGVVFSLPFGVIGHFVQLKPIIMALCITPLTGAIAGITWWLIAQPTDVGILHALFIGAVLTSIVMVLESGLKFNSIDTAD